VNSWLRTAAFLSIFPMLLLGSPAHGATHKPKTSKIRDLDDAVANNVILTKFASLVAASNLGTFLSSRGPFTLFVPTNSAFSKLPPGMLDDLLLPQNQTQLQRIVLFHLVNGKIFDARDLTALKSLVSCEGNPLPLRRTKSGTQFVIKARIIHADIKCSNGMLHEIDTLLMPPQVVLVSRMAGPAAAALKATNAPPANETNAAPESVLVPATGTNVVPTETNAPAGMNGG